MYGLNVLLMYVGHARCGMHDCLAWSREPPFTVAGASEGGAACAGWCEASGVPLFVLYFFFVCAGPARVGWGPEIFWACSIQQGLILFPSVLHNLSDSVPLKKPVRFRSKEGEKKINGQLNKQLSD